MDEKDSPKVTFARAPFSNQVFSPKAKERFDNLPSWQRNLVDRIIEHGDFELACRESNLPVKDENSIDAAAIKKLSMMDALESGGLNPRFLVEQLKECLEAKVFRLDKDGNPYPDVRDLRLKLETLRLIVTLRGDFTSAAKNPKDGKEDETFMELFGKYAKSKKVKNDGESEGSTD